MTAPLPLPAGERPRVSVLVPAFRPLTLAACLASLARNLPSEPACEVIASLNGPNDPLLAAAQGVSGLRTVSSPVNLGFPAGCNLARAVARGEYLVLLHDDVEIEPGWLEALVAAADANPEAGAIGGVDLWPDGTRVQTAGLVWWSDGSFELLDQEQPPEHSARRGLHAVDACSSVALLVRASTWDAVGGLDDDFFPAGHVDQDLAMRIRRYGQAVLCEPRARTRHIRSAGRSAAFKRFTGTRNALRFLERWGPELAETQEAPGERRAAEVERALQRAETRRRSAAEALGELPVETPAASGGPPFTPDATAEEKLAIGLRYSERHLALRIAHEAEVEPALEHFETKAGELQGESDRLRAEIERTQAALDAIVSGGWWRLRERLLPLARLVARIRRAVR